MTNATSRKRCPATYKATFKVYLPSNSIDHDVYSKTQPTIALC
uniref:Uncharacterized protein n=1 Tax=Setaria italica TaxID=4555 RepID=K3Z1A5_SETIT